MTHLVRIKKVTKVTLLEHIKLHINVTIFNTIMRRIPSSA